jgi:hypothetical protein
MMKNLFILNGPLLRLAGPPSLPPRPMLEHGELATPLNRGFRQSRLISYA